jgi:hypothetical protein
LPIPAEAITTINPLEHTPSWHRSDRYELQMPLVH